LRRDWIGRKVLQTVSEDEMRLDGKVAIITGGGSGFGKGMAERFAAEGAKVLVADLNGDAAGDVAKAINGKAIKTDVANAADVKAMFDTATGSFGKVDILSTTLALRICPHRWRVCPKMILTGSSA